MSLKILHTSDLHLEAKLDFLGEKSEEHRKQLVRTFEELISKAVSEKYDLVLIAGDLFDTPFPGERVKAFVLESFKKLVDHKIYLAVIAGNHDRLEKGSVYLDQRFSELSKDYVCIFDHVDKTEWIIGALDTTVYGVSLTKQKDISSPLARIQKTAKTKNTIALLHGSLETHQNTNNPLNQKDLQQMNFSYTALGDWHSTMQVSAKPAIWYSGSPELIHVDQTGAGSFLSVELGDDAKVTPVKIGKKDSEKITLDITGAQTLTDLETKWRQLSIQNPKEKFVQLSLTGVKNLSAKFNESEVRDLFSEKAYYLKMKDLSKLELTEEELENFPEEFLVGKYIRLLQKKKGEDYSQNKIIDEAIQLGVRLLQDKA